jgi:hypothetical protein
MVLSLTHPETLTDMMPPTIEFVSPGAAAFFGYSHVLPLSAYPSYRIWLADDTVCRVVRRV